MTKIETLGIKFKEIEKHPLPYKLTGKVIVRMDGRGFHNYTKGCDKPFDIHLRNSMREAMLACMKEANCKFGYHQSDEMSLYFPDITQVFGGKSSKILSILPVITSLEFNDNMKKDKKAHFDCRLTPVNSNQDVIDYFYWRESDAYKNSITMIAYSFFSHKEMLNINTENKIKMLDELHKMNDFCNKTYPRKYIFGEYISLFEKTYKLKDINEKIKSELPLKHDFLTGKTTKFTRKYLETKTDICSIQKLAIDNQYDNMLKLIKSLNEN